MEPYSFQLTFPFVPPDVLCRLRVLLGPPPDAPPVPAPAEESKDRSEPVTG